MPAIATAIALTLTLALTLCACGGETTHNAGAVTDSLPFMTARGVSNLISDSGVVRYKIIAEEWLLYTQTPQRPSRWDFVKGFFMQKFADDTNTPDSDNEARWRTEWYIQSDTAYCHHDDLWELRGRVIMRNTQGAVFRTEEIFWDMASHELYSTLFVHIKEPERELQGYNFRSNEQLTRYTIYNSSGMLPVEDNDTPPLPDTTSNIKNLE